MYRYKTKGVCSQLIQFDIENGILKNVKFVNGCNGNLTGISKLVEGMPVRDVILKLKGIRCGWKSTSCPDQLAAALEEALCMEKDVASHSGPDSNSDSISAESSIAAKNTEKAVNS